LAANNRALYKSQKNEATLRFATIVEGRAGQTVHFFGGGAAPAGGKKLNREELTSSGVVGKKRESCGKVAFSRQAGLEEVCFIVVSITAWIWSVP